MSKIFLLIILLIPVNFLAQNNKEVNLGEELIGVIFSADEPVFLTESGYYQVRINDPYLDYYRQIYQDSTIQNPNLELKSNFSLNLIPIIGIGNDKNNLKQFDEHIFLNQILIFSDSGNLILTDFGVNFLDSLQHKHKNEE